MPVDLYIFFRLYPETDPMFFHVLFTHHFSFSRFQAYFSVFCASPCEFRSRGRKSIVQQLYISPGASTGTLAHFRNLRFWHIQSIYDLAKYYLLPASTTNILESLLLSNSSYILFAAPHMSPVCIFQFIFGYYFKRR